MMRPSSVVTHMIRWNTRIKDCRLARRHTCNQNLSNRSVNMSAVAATYTVSIRQQQKVSKPRLSQLIVQQNSRQRGVNPRKRFRRSFPQHHEVTIVLQRRIPSQTLDPFSLERRQDFVGWSCNREMMMIIDHDTWSGRTSVS